MSAAKPASEEFENVTKVSKTGNKGVDNLVNTLRNLR
jgi:hypothetical protein